MSKKPKIDHELLSILEDYQLFLDGDKSVDMPFCVDKVDRNHVSSLRGDSELRASLPFGNTVLTCEVKDKNEYRYSISILSDRIRSRMLFRMDEGDGAHWNRHFPIPVEQQQVLTPHFHRKGEDGIDYAYRTDSIESSPSPLNIHDGFTIFCEECHINSDKIEIQVQEKGTLPLQFESEMDPLKDVYFP